jgi:SP family general alpha glucoside:H+ symporter-like MFS transporter
MASDKIAEDAAPSGQATVDKEKDQYVQDQYDQVTRLKARDRVIQGAKTATEKEQSMTLLQGIKLYPKAIAWSMLISTCIVMEGYDVCLINNFCRCFPFQPTPELRSELPTD